MQRTLYGGWLMMIELKSMDGKRSLQVYIRICYDALNSIGQHIRRSWHTGAASQQ